MSDKTTALAHRQESAPALDMQELMRRALESGAEGAETLERLVALHERMQDRSARAQFYRALADFQAECPPIRKNRRVSAGNYSYDYAELDFIADQIRPLLHKHGLSYSFDSELIESDGRAHMRTRCILRHVASHSEQASFTAPVDQQAKMNDPQKAASGLSYTRRYALILVLGLTTGDKDDDGRAAGAATITEEEAADLRALFDEVIPAEKREAEQRRFLSLLAAESFETIAMRDYGKAVRALERKRDAR